MGLDFKRLDAAIDWAIAEDAKRQAGGESLWNQGIWAVQTPCGTACCLAGNIVVSAGYKPVFMRWSSSADTATVELDGDDEQLIDELALDLLGLVDENDRETFGEVFAPDNDIEAIKHYRDYFARQEGVPVRFGHTEHETLGDIEHALYARLGGDA